ncbi:MAG TPA: serine/threonine-protein kinase, partial [Polyangia bacterium]|nr:serine/threonine-protein kinase [Polyangia bacterium]
MAGARVLETVAAPTVAAGESIGRYVVESCIAGGGMGVVYRARDPELNRPLAIKLLQPEYTSGDGAEVARLRLLREAQALARISHPNVIAVHDVGRFRDSIFVAMELIDGVTVKAWLEETPRAVRDILRVFRDAASALAATHRAGLVHRDFKPTNVMVARDGRVCVLDFGLAREQHADSTLHEPLTPLSLPSLSADSPSESFASTTSSDRLLSEQLTSAGQIVGTPAFMAPEQHRGESVDAKADQFSFCASFYWALCGQLPFRAEANKKRKLSAAKHAGVVQPIPSRVHLPRRVKRLLWRGLSTMPDARLPSMDAVVRELDIVLRPKGLIVAAAAAAVVLVGTIAFGVHERRTAGLCRNLDAEMRGVWNDSAQKALRQRLLGTGRVNAASTFDHVVRALDDYTSAWTNMRVEACEATHVRGVQSAQLLDRRMSCLGRAKEQVSALVSLMSTEADGNMVDKAVGATLALPRLSACVDPTALASSLPPPDDPAARARIDAVDARMAAAAALRDTGRYKDSLAATREVVRQANELQHAPTQANAELLLGSLEEEAGDFAA